MENLGKKATDKVTGFKGVITSKHSYLTGCNQYGVVPTAGKDNKPGGAKYFDEGRLKIGKRKINLKDVQGDENGCDFREHPGD